jgi:hypothetical protein
LNLITVSKVLYLVLWSWGFETGLIGEGLNKVHPLLYRHRFEILQQFFIFAFVVIS